MNRFGQWLVCGVVLCLASCATVFEPIELEGEIVTAQWRLPISTGYKAIQEAELYNIQKPDMEGAFQLSTVSKPEGAVTEADIVEWSRPFVERRGELVRVPADGMLAYTSTFNSSGVYWKAWFFGVGNEIVFITYNGFDRKVSELEVNEATAMVDGFTVVEPGS